MEDAEADGLYNALLAWLDILDVRDGEEVGARLAGLAHQL